MATQTTAPERDQTPSPFEDPIDPDQVIVDAHHHLFDRPGLRYMVDELLDDLRSGHRVESTVYLQALAHYRPEGPAPLKPVGETEFACAVGERFASGEFGRVRACATIVGFADLTLGDAVRPVLEAHIEAGGGPERGRFRGVRQIAAWDPDPAMVNPAYAAPRDLLDGAAFRKGFAHLAPLGLSFETYVFFHQLPKVASLARAFPDTPIAVNHCGGPVGGGPFGGPGPEVLADWSRYMKELAGCENVTVKLGGLGMPRCGFGFDQQPDRPSSRKLAEAWKPWFEGCINAFGARRCMVSSNFPVDKVSYGYAVGWNAMKRIAAGSSPSEKDDLFRGTAARFYRLPSQESR